MRIVLKEITTSDNTMGRQGEILEAEEDEEDQGVGTSPRRREGDTIGMIGVEDEDVEGEEVVAGMEEEGR